MIINNVTFSSFGLKPLGPSWHECYVSGLCHSLVYVLPLVAEVCLEGQDLLDPSFVSCLVSSATTGDSLAISSGGVTTGHCLGTSEWIS